MVNEVDFLLQLGKNIKKYRIIAGLSTEKVEEITGLEIGIVAKIEDGKISVGLEECLKILRVLNISISDLVDDIN